MKRIAVCYNGEIYNFIELREEPKKLGDEFQIYSDTEVIVHKYKQWEYYCLDHFDGMLFDFALYDISKRELFIEYD
ncbi:hypothetical protein [Coxiella-like endosymbiont]|uniref:hypothetical protein n=1 Tax=Coxiella-like endosymbiont TaxID=1592897 RepID=UPI0034E2295C